MDFTLLYLLNILGFQSKFLFVCTSTTLASQSNTKVVAIVLNMHNSDNVSYIIYTVWTWDKGLGQEEQTTLPF